MLLPMHLFADLMVPNNGFAQVGLLLWAIPLLFWGALSRDAFARIDTEMLPAVMWCLAGAFVIGAWGQAVQSTALEFCRA